MRGEILKVANFLSKSLSDEQLGKLAEHLHFDNFQKNESVNNESGKKTGAMNQDGHFIRKGNYESLLECNLLYFTFTCSL